MSSSNEHTEPAILPTIDQTEFDGTGDPLTLIVNPKSNDADARRVLARLETMGCDVLKVCGATESEEQVVYTVDPRQGGPNNNP